MKNEYPLDNNQNHTSIQKLYIYNKKIYQFMIDGHWHNKFKGCRNPNDGIDFAFKNGDCKYRQ